MKRLIIRGLFVIAVLAISLILIFRERLPFGNSNSSFACDQSSEITRIEFLTPEQKLILERNGDGWVVNGKTEARKSGILFITRILREISIKSPVSGELFDTEITGKGVQPVRVRVYDKIKKIKSFLVYKTGSNDYGNIMKMREGAKPFIVYVPGYDGEIGSAFNLNELFWQPYNVFNFLPSEIARVDFENLADSTASFRINVSNHRFRLSAGGRELNGWDSTLVIRYLSYFAWVPFEKWELGMSNEERNRLEAAAPHYRISLTNTKGHLSVLSMWDRVSEEGGKKSIDSDRLLGRLQSNREFFVLRYFDIDPLIKKRSYFFPE